jgi:hypothetical protein
MTPAKAQDPVQAVAYMGPVFKQELDKVRDKIAKGLVFRAFITAIAEAERPAEPYPMDRAGAAWTAVAGLLPGGDPGMGNGLPIVPPLPNPADAISKVIKLPDLTDRDLWIRAGLVVAGLVLLGVGAAAIVND